MHGYADQMRGNVVTFSWNMEINVCQLILFTNEMMLFRDVFRSIYVLDEPC